MFCSGSRYNILTCPFLNYFHQPNKKKLAATAFIFKTIFKDLTLWCLYNRILAKLIIWTRHWNSARAQKKRHRVFIGSQEKESPRVTFSEIPGTGPKQDFWAFTGKYICLNPIHLNISNDDETSHKFPLLF